MAYPHSKPEVIADGIVHVAGLVMAVPASVWLLGYAEDAGADVIWVCLYIVCMLISFAVSAAYNLTPIGGLRAQLNKLDHAAIYFKIAGTYAPLVGVIGSAYAFGILAIVWGLAILGAAAKLWLWLKKGRASLVLYLLMGWLSLLLIWPMWNHLPRSALGLMLLGGVLYSGGAVVYSKKSLRFHTAIWHGFVLAASICFFIAITLSL